MTDTSPSVMAAILGLLSGIVILLDIPPLVWHAKHHNFAPALLVAWFIILNLMTVTNAIIWPSTHPELHFSGRGLCDVQAKLIVGSWSGIAAAVAVIMRNLARLMDPDNAVPSLTSAQKRRALAIEVTFCIVLPVVLMALHFIVQEVRFYVDPVTGCNPATDDSWPSVVLVFIWPALLAMGAGYYAAMLIFRLYRYRQQFNEILSSHNTTRSRFNRLWQIGILCIVWVLPQSLYQAVKSCTSAEFHDFDFAKLHDPANWNIIVYNYGAVNVSFDRWIRILGGALLFSFFGLGQDAVKMYKKWLEHLGIGRFFPSLTQQRRTRPSCSNDIASPASNVWRRTKDIFTVGRKGSSAESGITMLTLASSLTEPSPTKSATVMVEENSSSSLQLPAAAHATGQPMVEASRKGSQNV